MRLPDGSGMTLLHKLEEARRPEKVIVITAYGSAENAVEALKAGAFDYLTKPVDLRQFRSVVAAALGRVATPVPPAQPAGPLSQSALARLVGRSAAMGEVRVLVEKVARSMAPVLVQGESGTGKELVARAIHEVSPARARPSWRSTAAPSRSICWRPSSSATARAPSPARRKTGPASSRPRMAAPCSSTRSATCRWPCSPSCCA
jgi:two-component system response regulator PilR (NtrC family)